ncbi:MAG TPA: hypothetical protein VG755_00215 [Nannocystaceae bacterium]|nr:hypothetical protein [Nannocystaceae bacterium]
MYTLETTQRCPHGTYAAALLDALGEPHTIVVKPEGSFLAEHGRPGPRLVDGSHARLAADATGPLAAMLAERRPALAGVIAHAHARCFVAIGALVRSEPDARPTALAHLHTQLDELDERLAALASEALDDPTLDAFLVGPALAVARGLVVLGDTRVLATRLAATAHGAMLQRVRARIDAAAAELAAATS